MSSQASDILFVIFFLLVLIITVVVINPSAILCLVTKLSKHSLDHFIHICPSSHYLHK